MTVSRAPTVVWVACFADIPAVSDTWMACLDPAERTAAERLQAPRAAINFAGRRVMARQVLGNALGRPPTSLQFSHGPWGKPAVCPHPGERVPAFNMSRSRELAVLAINWEQDVGIDIETVEPIEAGLARLFTPAEQAVLASLSEPDRTKALYRYWVCKEAAMKMTGRGLSLAPDRVHIDDTPVGSFARLRYTDDPHPTEILHLGLFGLPNALGAVAAGRPVCIDLRWWRTCQDRAACSACTTSLIA